MERIASVTKEKAMPEVREIYQNIEKKLGRIPNIFLNMGNSPAVLQGFFALSDAADKTSLSPKLREQIALVVSQTNDCNYCLSAHSAIAKSTGLNEESILQARRGEAQDLKTQAILRFAKAIVDKKGHLSSSEVEKLKDAGVSDRELVEIILVINLTIFTNYFNHITDPKIDFPIAPELALKH
jgi:uncharacterized peroxidase-related enzyme